LPSLQQLSWSGSDAQCGSLQRLNSGRSKCALHRLPQRRSHRTRRVLWQQSTHCMRKQQWVGADTLLARDCLMGLRMRSGIQVGGCSCLLTLLLTSLLTPALDHRDRLRQALQARRLRVRSATAARHLRVVLPAAYAHHAPLFAPLRHPLRLARLRCSLRCPYAACWLARPVAVPALCCMHRGPLL
jgi:hypothetical protein